MDEKTILSVTDCSNKAELLDKLRQTSRAERRRFGTAQGQRQSIRKMLSKLILRYDDKARIAFEYGDGVLGNWYGLQQLAFETLDTGTSTVKQTYQMDRDLCGVFAIPEGATCYGIWVGTSLIEVYFENANRPVQELAKIKRLLVTVMPWLLQKDGCSMT